MPYLKFADQLANGRFLPSDLPVIAAQIPPPDPLLLHNLADYAAYQALSDPKRGRAITAVAEAAAAHTADPFLQGLAAWYTARAANAWYHPELVATAVSRARTYFTQAGKDAWLAACDWQQYAEPWLGNDFYQAIAVLEQALRQLENSELGHWTPYCRLSLAYGYILTGQFAVATAQIDQCETVFRQANDHLHLARCWLHRASALRRQLHNAEALTFLEKALAVFQQLNAPVEQAKAAHQLGYAVLNHRGDYQQAEEYFASAAALFAEKELALWQALSLNGLVQLCNNVGRLAEAYQLLDRVREIYGRFPLIGLQADSALESGIQSLFRGDWATALQHLQQAEEKYARLNLEYMAATAVLYQGDGYIEASHYYQALRCLEKALAAFQRLDHRPRQAECQMRLSKTWLALGRSDLAAPHLQATAAYYASTQQPARFKAVLTYQADILLRRQEYPQAIALLQHALEVAQGSQLQGAQARRALGEAFYLAGEWETARQQLHTAVCQFQKMDTFLDEAACQLSLGLCYRQLGNHASALAAWERALALNETAVPAISWQAHGHLAALVAQEGDSAGALEQYHLAIKALARLRQNIWQPALADSFLSQPALMLDQAVTLAGQSPTTHHLLTFLEESKAQIVNQQLVAAPLHHTPQPELAELAAEIRWLQQQIMGSAGEHGQPAAQMRDWRTQLVQKAQQYDQLAARLERQALAQPVFAEESGDFAADIFCQQAVQALGQKWLALDYYLTETHLYGVALTPGSRENWVTPLSPAVRLALRMCTQGGHGRPWTTRHLTTLGHWLLPAAIQAQLTPDTTLLISSHRVLHRLPWAALYVSQPARPLVLAGMPIITPSWQSLRYLWQRAPHPPPPINHGLALAVSAFQGRHAPLPQIRLEAARLQALFGPNLDLLEEEEATAVTLYELAQEKGLEAYDFLHIASHAFADQLTGRLSGLALYDRDLWLDEIYRLAPLPRLVTLSACSSLLSRLFAGDEQMGLAVTCLAAGAQQVVGSLWPLTDEGMMAFMGRFYAHLQQGTAVTEALAQTQRELSLTDMPITEWGSLQCIGQP